MYAYYIYFTFLILSVGSVHLWSRRRGREEGLLVFRGEDIRDGKRVFRGRDMINGGGVKRMILELLKSPIVTEKSVGLLEKNQYTFDVDVKLTKPQIKRLIQELFQVEVKAINTHRPPRKKRGRGAYAGLQASNYYGQIRIFASPV